MKKYIAYAVVLLVVVGAVLFLVPHSSESPTDVTTKEYVDYISTGQTEQVVNEKGDKEVTLGATGTKVVLEKIVIDPTQDYTFTFALCGQDVNNGKIVAVYKCPKGPMPGGTTQYRQTPPKYIVKGEMK